jgi:hypothetical protein
MRFNGTYFIRPLRIFLPQRVTPIYSRMVLLFCYYNAMFMACNGCMCVCVCVCVCKHVHFVILDAFRAPLECNKIFFDMFYYRNQKCTSDWCRLTCFSVFAPVMRFLMSQTSRGPWDLSWQDRDTVGHSCVIVKRKDTVICALSTSSRRPGGAEARLRTLNLTAGRKCLIKSTLRSS